MTTLQEQLAKLGNTMFVADKVELRSPNRGLFRSVA